MADSDELPAETRLGEYEIEGVIGRGGMGTVYAAWHPVLRSRAAIKVLQREVCHNAGMVERFVSEAQAASRITHPNIIKVFGFGELPDGRKYFVMEYLEGESMGAWLARGRPDGDQTLELLLQVCEALEAAHREGIVHRDLKPDNLWIARPKHGRPYIKVLDFGIAKAIEGPSGRSSTKTGSLLGTPQFMSPEQCTGRGVDHRTDIYAMGGILYLIYCGRPPFLRESAAELVAAHLYDVVPRPSSFVAMPEALEGLILACLEKDPARRPSSAAELATRLKAALATAGDVLPVPLQFQVSAPARTPRIVEPTAIDDQGVTPPVPLARTARLVEPTVVDEIAAPIAPDMGGPDLVVPPKPLRRPLWALAVAVVALLGLSGTWIAYRSLSRQASSRQAPSAASAVPEAPTAPPAAVAPSPAAEMAPGPAPPPATGKDAAPVPSAARKARGVARPAGVPDTTNPSDKSSSKSSSKASRSEREGLIKENPFE